MINGRRIRELRETHGMSADQLARQLHISKSQLLRYEHGKADATTDVLVRFALFFKVSSDYLVGLARDPDPPDPAPYLGDNWPPATTDELALLEHFRKDQFLDAIKIILESHAAWRKKNPNSEFE